LSGGEEFAVVLYDAPRDRALTIAERIRSAFAEVAAVIAGYEVGATVSIGLVQHEGPMVALTELLWKANPGAPSGEGARPQPCRIASVVSHARIYN
jgi:diguanylate cyclase (GGDEF)-like protein